MRTLSAAVIMLLSAHAVAASERAAVFDRLARLDPVASLRAYEYFECTEAAAKEAASLDAVTPSAIMARGAATAAAKQCASGGTALAAVAGKRQAEAIKAAVQRANVETALAVRQGDPVMVCAVAWQGCAMK